MTFSNIEQFIKQGFNRVNMKFDSSKKSSHNVIENDGLRVRGSKGIPRCVS